ncbi:MAG: PAS domain S-box protein, partial [Candidatus Eisenbacteria bacterium]|nr:PAS domain S-box protein [Candidatus Eisenbacteria bacterium]
MHAQERRRPPPGGRAAERWTASSPGAGARTTESVGGTMRAGHKAVLLAALIGLASWTAMPILDGLDMRNLSSAPGSMSASAANELLGRLAILVSFVAGAVLIGHTLNRLRWSEARTRHMDTLLKTARDVVPFRHDEADRYALLKEACGRLRRARGYESAWMACVGEDGTAEVAIHEGCKGPFGTLSEDMKRGRWPACAEQALSKSGPVLVRDVVAQCAGCPLQEKRYGRGALAIRLETEGGVYGVACVKSTIESLSAEDEQAMLARFAKDMGHALKSIELAKRRSETTRELEFRLALGAAVGRTGVAMDSDSPLRSAATSILDDLIQLTGSRSAAAYRLNAGSGKLSLVTAVDRDGEAPEEEDRFPLELAPDVAERMASAWNREPAVRGDGEPDSPSAPMAALSCVGGEIFGFLTAEGATGVADERQREAARTLSESFADICRVSELRERLAVRDKAVSDSPYPIVVLTHEGVIAHMNPSLAKLWQLDDPGKLLGADQAVLWESPEIGHNMLRKLQESGSWTGELVARRSDDSWVRVRVAATASGGEKGLPRRFVLTITDLTEIRHAETTVRVFGRVAAKAACAGSPRDLFLEARQELGRVLDTRNFLVALRDEERDRVSLPFFLDEKDQDQFSTLPPGKTLTARVLETEKPVLLSAREIEELASAGELDVVGSPCQCWLGVPLRDGDALLGVLAVQSYQASDEYDDHDVGVLSHAADIVSAGLTRISATRELAESRGRSDAVAQTLTSGLVDTDSNGRIISWNKSAETMFGYSSAEAIGRQFSMIVPEGFLQAHVDGLRRAVSSEGQGYVRANVEGVGLRKDGSEFPMELSIGAWRAADQTFFTAVLSDATSKKQTEEELQFLSSIPLQVSDALI